MLVQQQHRQDLIGVEKIMAAPFEIIKKQQRKRSSAKRQCLLVLTLGTVALMFLQRSQTLGTSTFLRADSVSRKVSTTATTTATTTTTATLVEEEEEYLELEQPQRQKQQESKTPKSPVSNLRLVLMGDSVTRFQYMSLINFLHTGAWNTRYIQDDMFPRDITIQGTFRGNWSNFYEFSNSLFYGKEVCDCYRQSSHTYKHTVRENRYYADPVANNYVTYIQRFGNFATRGMFQPNQVYDKSLQMHNPWLNKNTTDFAWEFSSWEAAIREYVALLKPKPQFFIFNAGKWPHDLNATTLTGIRNALVEHDITGIYKTTTRSKNETSTDLEAYEKVACKLFPCLNLSWTAHLPNQAYSDRVHFKAGPYHAMNDQMLQKLNRLVSAALE